MSYFLIDLPAVVVSEIRPVVSVNPGIQSTSHNSLNVNTKISTTYIIFKCLYVASFPGSPSPEHKHGNHEGRESPEEVGHCMLPYIRDRILELAKDRLLVSCDITYRS